MAEEKEARIKIVSTGHTSRAAASRIYLDDKDITHLVRDLKVSIAGETRRWNVELTVISHVEIDVTALTEFKVRLENPQE